MIHILKWISCQLKDCICYCMHVYNNSKTQFIVYLNPANIYCAIKRFTNRETNMVDLFFYFWSVNLTSFDIFKCEK